MKKIRLPIIPYQGIYKDESPDANPEYLLSELLETRSRMFDWKINPHIHTALFQVFFIEKGEFKFYESKQEHVHQGPCILTIPPAALHGFDYSPDTTGRILTISDAMLHSLFHGSSSVSSMFTQIQRLTEFAAPYTAEHIISLFEALDWEISNDYEEKRLMIRISLQSLFLALYRLYRQQEVRMIEPDNRSLAYFKSFQQRIRQGGAAQGIAELARELAITTVHLNRVCRSVASKSAIEIIHDYQLDEAQKYLTYTSHTVSEIAYLLHFEYPNYFARFFKKKTGLTPTQYRDKKML